MNQYECNKTIKYPYTNINVLPGDILYSSIGRSTYFVGHCIIIGTDNKIKEVLPGTPGWHTITIGQFWNRHNKGDKIMLLRSAEGANEAATWISKNLHLFKSYNLINYDIENIEKSYCYKFVTQAYYFGANVQIVTNMNRLLTPNDIKKSPKLDKIAVIVK